MESNRFNPDDPDLQRIIKIPKFVPILLGLLIAAYAIFMIISGSGKGDTEPKQSVVPISSTLEEWKVTNPTNIYWTADFDSKTKGELGLGDIVLLPEGVISPDCKTISEPDLMPATLCYMRVKNTNVEGWILKKWLEKK